MQEKRFVDELRKSAREKFIPVMREKTTEILYDTVAAKKPERVLEIGTSLGVSGITALLAGAKSLTTIDIDGEAIEEAKKNFEKCHVRDRAEFIEGDCFEVLKYMGGNRYDMVIIDGPKSKYSELYDTVFPMLDGGGVIFCDDVDYFGKVEQENPERKHRTIIKGMQNFIKKITADERVNVRLIEVEDGVAVITLKTEEE